ncbi:hypothetical protein ACFOLJ_00380 [Rugamonas sp. CCM 8940]|uniref:hypothetical protein n=1 Tax=Rugamonas sp. CCM 8940 TaxID=2765359 RepID=UPI0018F682DA|nr:hypothetical protein [Rugamonas sp. CCM 8940]MBJ7312874.1 hypothetical protein [Rugamonas sp. CCM 8940]
MRSAFLGGCVLLVSLNVGAASAVGSLEGKWKISKVLDSQQTTSLSDDEVSKLIGKDLLIESKHIQFDSAVCVNPKLKTERHRMYAHFIKEYNFEPKHLPLPDTVTEIQIECDDPVGIDFLYIRDKRQVVLFWKGFFLNAVKQAR